MATKHAVGGIDHLTAVPANFDPGEEADESAPDPDRATDGR